jgi:hypothetical protein
VLAGVHYLLPEKRIQAVYYVHYAKLWCVDMEKERSAVQFSLSDVGIVYGSTAGRGLGTPFSSKAVLQVNAEHRLA